MTLSRLPLTVIGGFLGSGKTTLLNQLLRQANGQRLAVLVNDFGALNIDAELVASRGADAIALSNGCVCCAIGDDLSAALIRVLEARPAFDALVIEASGVSDPWRIAQVGLVDPGLSLGGVIVLVDASSVLAQHDDALLADSLRRQIQAADWLLVNKTDLVDPDELAKLHIWLDRLAPATPRFETREAQLPAALLPVLLGALNGDSRLATAVQACGNPGHQHDDKHLHGNCGRAANHASQFETVSWRPELVLSAPVLRSLLRAMPAGVLRLKGLVRTDTHGWAELQFAGRHGSLRKALRPPVGGAAVVMIGLRNQLPGSALDTVFGSRYGDHTEGTRLPTFSQ